MKKTISRSKLEEYYQWIKKETSSTWQCYEDETAARYGAWDNPKDRRYLSDIKCRAETQGSFSSGIEEMLSREEENFRLKDISKVLKELAKKQNFADRAVAFARLFIKCMSKDRFPDDDEMKDIFHA